MDVRRTISTVFEGRRRVVAGLLVLNVVIAAALLLSIYRVPAAFAQAGIERGEFICASAKATGFSYDVLYVLDLKDHRLHAFHPGIPRTRKLINVPSRDLLADFGKEEGP